VGGGACLTLQHLHAALALPKQLCSGCFCLGRGGLGHGLRDGRLLPCRSSLAFSGAHRLLFGLPEGCHLLLRGPDFGDVLPLQPLALLQR
jgi:hypothetical protein